jgi:uncharacterized protein YacL
MKALFWVLVAILCVYIFYTGAMAVWSYLEITSLVEDVVNERASRTDRNERAARIRDEIAKKVADSGIKIDGRSVSVSDTGPTLDVGVRWNWPVVSYQGEDYLSLPLKHERTFNIPAR